MIERHTIRQNKTSSLSPHPAAAARRSSPAGGRRKGACLLSLLVLLFATPVVATEPPARVVSINLCLDQLVLALAAPGQVVAVSDMAHDPHLSAQWQAAQALPAVRVRVEEILAQRPDLVFLDAFAPSHVVGLLKRAGVRVAQFPEASTFDDVVARVRSLATALGRPEAGATLAQRMQERQAVPADGVHRPLAAVWQANGFSVGRGTLQDDLLRRAGFRNLAAERSAGPFEPLPLEALVRAAPDLLILEGATSDRPSLAEALMTHRAARQAFGTARTLVMPHSLWLCAGPQNVEALDRLVAVRRSIERRR